MAKVNAPNELTTEVPLTVDAQRDFLEKTFEDLPRIGKLLVPDETVYPALPDVEQAEMIKKRLCHWLGVKPGYIALELENTKNVANDGSHYVVYVTSEVLADEFKLAAYLAYSLTRYLVEIRKQIHLPADSQALLLSQASITFGLGLVIGNGLEPRSGGLRNRRHQGVNWLLGSVMSAEYYNMLKDSLKQRYLATISYRSGLTPWLAKALGTPSSKHPLPAIAMRRHQIQVNNFKSLGLAWMIILIVLIGGFIWLQRVRPLPAKQREAKSQVDLLEELYDLCHDSLNYDRHYMNQGDIQADRALNAEALRCQSLGNQLSAAQIRYRQLTQP